MTTYPASSASDELLARVKTNLGALRTRVAASAPDPSAVRIVAVTKTFGLDVVAAAVSLGLFDVGENYLNELESKRAASDDRIRWHYLGAVQTNKIARLCRVADVLCGVSREKELEHIARCDATPGLYIQVDYTGAAERNGAMPSEVSALVARAGALDLDVRGLMTVAPANPQGARVAFRDTRHLVDDLGLDECSMGMSEDLEIACELGTTEIRVGRALFGERVVPGTLA
jgi:uncharacterized pyridoxal phosphate-containing UPF0001 family protein